MNIFTDKLTSDLTALVRGVREARWRDDIAQRKRRDAQDVATKAWSDVVAAESALGNFMSRLTRDPSGAAGAHDATDEAKELT